MNAENFSIKQLLAMAHSPVRNYVVPGLTSWLIGQPSEHGTVRLFQSEREHQESMTPHSHRFDFQCWVLEGSVRNRLWTTGWYDERNTDQYRRSVLHYEGAMGKYRSEPLDVKGWAYEEKTFGAGECYSMKAHEIHSIYFSRGCRVLFFEGPTVNGHSQVLEPWVNGEVIPTMEVKPWMFQRSEA